MPFHIVFQEKSNKVFFATIERLSDGFFWNNNSKKFELNPISDDKKILILEGHNENSGSYLVSISGLNNVKKIRLRIHNNQFNKVISMRETIIMNDQEVDFIELLINHFNLFPGV